MRGLSIFRRCRNFGKIENKMDKEQNKTRFKKKLEDMTKRKLIYNNQGRYVLLPERRKIKR